jgi:hypothetical protein
MRTKPRAVLTLVMLVATSGASVASAQGTARSLDFETSIRAAGMGSASAGVWWGEPGVWGNPASLAEVRGVGWVDGRTRLVPSLAPEVWLKSSRLLLGGAGVGLSLMGEPLDGIGGMRLDYGTDQDPFGNPIPGGFEKTQAWGIGVAPIRLFDAFRSAGGASGASGPRRVDVAGGYQHKNTLVDLAPGSPLFNAAEADCLDWGVSGRVTVTPDLSPEAPFHMELSGGYAVLNANDAQFEFGTASSPPSRIHRKGLAVHASVRSSWSAPGAAPPNWVLSGMPQLIELGAARDWEQVSAGGGPTDFTVDRLGLEGTVLGVLTGRIGHVSDRVEDIVGYTWGFGARIPVGPWGSVAYDYASVPESTDLPNVTRRGWSAWVDPIRIMSDLGPKR